MTFGPEVKIEKKYPRFLGKLPMIILSNSDNDDDETTGAAAVAVVAVAATAKPATTMTMTTTERCHPWPSTPRVHT